MSDLKPLRIQAEVFYAQDMHTLNLRFDEDNKKYACTLGSLSDKAAEALEDLGIKIKEKDVPGKHIVGKSLYQFKLSDEEGNEIDPKIVGNGTKVIALVTAYSHKLSKKHGNSPSIKKLIVTDLVRYDPEGSIAEKDEVL